MKISVRAGATCLLLSAAFSSAQAQLPIVDGLLSGGLLGGGTSIIGGLFDGNSPPGGLLGDSLNLPLASIPLLTDPLNALLDLSSLGNSVVGNPEVLFGIASGTGLPLASDLIPIVGILTTDPTNLVDFFLNAEGTILSPTLSPIPAIPLLTAPLGL